MCETKIKNVIINAYIIFTIITGGFIGIFTFNGIINECCVKAQYIIVDCQGNGNYTTIQEAITYANPGDIIYVWNGIYNENIAIDKTLTLIGNGTHNTIINGSGAGDVIYITANWVNISGFTIQNSGDDLWMFYDSAIEVRPDYDHVYVYDNYITNCTHGIYLKDSDYAIIKNNNISNNSGNGIECYGSDSNFIKENNCTFNRIGISTYCSYSNSIFNNTCNFNEYDGINILGWNDKILNNTCTFNKWNGITLEDDAGGSIISNNICNSNEKNGIFIDIYNDLNIIINNTCNLNWDDGIEIKESSSIVIKNNTCKSNLDSGFELFKSGNISIFNNNISMNKKGIYLFGSIQNEIAKNDITNNVYGLYLEQPSSSNKLIENFISTNSNTGIFILTKCDNNLLNYNLIISNTKQVVDSGNNNWSFQNEGNYWSDYFGLDNGANGRWKGDGIGDTNIPHPGAGYDDYPFIKPYGWRFPAIPELNIENDIDSDGNFTVSWNNKSRSIGFFLEEDTDIYFSSPTNYTKGWLQENGFNIFNFFNKQEDTYYYRIKSYNNYHISAWSDIVNVTVDYLPKIPENLKVSPVPDGNTLNISWNPNLKDTVQYGLYYLNDLTWEPLKNLTHPTTSYEHTGLKDGVSYSYKVCAIDSIGQSSNFSEIVSGIPKDIISPDVPKNLKATAISDHEIKLTWDTNIESDLAGYLIYINKSGSDKSTTFILNKTIYAKETSCIISELNEQITYLFKIKAFDEVPNNSTFSELAWATTLDLTPPKPPSDLKISNETYNSLTISWQRSVDRDVIGYIVYQSKSLSGEYKNRTGILSSTHYIDTGLMENTFYYYKIKSVDDANLTSLFSDYIFGITLIGQKPPEINNSVEDFELDEDTYNDTKINLNHWFKDINNDPLEFDYDENNNITITILPDKRVRLEPKANWSGQETLIFYANDSFKEISDSVIITVNPINDPPEIPKIISPKDGIEIIYGRKLNFSGSCYDPDLPYSDKLIFLWTSNIDNELGTGANISDIKLSVGKHNITLKVIDITGESSSVTIKIIVKDKNDTPKDDKRQQLNMNVIIMMIIIIILAIILTLLLFIYFKKEKITDLKNKKNDDKDDDNQSS